MCDDATSNDKLEEEINRLRELGPRETGNSEHVRFVDNIQSQLTQLKLLPSLSLDVYRDTRRFER